MWNISADYLTDTERYQLKQHLIRIQNKMPNQPITIIVLGNPGYAIELKQAISQAIIIYRKYFPNSDGDGDNSGHLRITPQQWYAAYATEIAPSYGIYYYAVNEPALTDQLISWSTEVAKILNQNGARGVFLNLSVGVPEKQDWVKANPLLREIAKRPKDLLIGLHEYSVPNLAYEFGAGPLPKDWPEKITNASWLLARYRELLLYCDRSGIPRPYIVFTEFGWDYIHAAANYQDQLPPSGSCDKTGGMWCNLQTWYQWLRGTGLDWEYYAYLQIQWAWNAIYRWDKEVLGFAFFCYGHQGRWGIYDAKLAPNFVSYMEQGDWRKKEVMPITPTHYISGSGTNVRFLPTTNATRVSSLTAEGHIVQRLKTETHTDGTWHKYRFVGGLEGWVRSDVHEFVELKPGVRLNAPYKTQLDTDPTADDFINDCGSAGSAMLMADRGVNKTVDEVSEKVFEIVDTPQHFNKFIAAVKEFGFGAEVRQGTHLTDIINSLNNGTPMMSLVNYNELRGINIPHFVVPVGYEVIGETLRILVHDSYHTEYVPYVHAKFVKAISNTLVQNNTAYQSMFLTTYIPPEGDDNNAELKAIVDEIETLLSLLKSKL